MADQDNRQQLADGDKQLCRGVVISVSYVTSLLGISKIAGMVLSMITFIIVAAAKDRLGICSSAPTSSFHFVEFVAMTTFWCCLVMFIVFLFKLDTKIPFIAWTLTELIWVSIDCIFFLIAFILNAVHTCATTTYQASAAFAFFSLAALGLNLVMVVLKFRNQMNEKKHGATSDPTVSNADTMHDF